MFTFVLTSCDETMTQEKLFKNLLIKCERFLVPIGIWPSKNNLWMTRFNIFILFGYSILVIVKNLLNPERETIENAFTLANGGLITVPYFLTLLIKREKCKEFFDFVKSDRKNELRTQDEKNLVISVGDVFQKISTGFLYILPTSILVRFVQPLLEFGYIQLFRPDKSFTLPPSMGIPTYLMGEIATYLVESLVRALMLTTLMGICTIFILSTLFICTQFHILSVDLKNMEKDEEIDGLIKEHQEILA